MRNNPVHRVPGFNVDRIDVAAGLKELTATGYDEPRTVMVIEHALMLWARGEEAAAERSAIDAGFHGVDFTSWRRVLAAARGAAERTAEHRPDTSEPGNWCVCGGLGQLHHTPGHVNCDPKCTAGGKL